MKTKHVARETLNIGLFITRIDGHHKLIKNLGPVPLQWVWSAVLKKNKDLGVAIDIKTGWMLPEIGQTVCLIKSEG